MAQLFAREDAPRRAARNLMHVCDVGDGGCCDIGEKARVLFRCHRCNYQSEWMVMGVTKSKRGIPCPNCSPRSLAQGAA